MFVQKRDYGAFLQSVRVNVGKEVGLENEEDAYLVLKELPTLEMIELRDAYEKGQKELLVFFKTVLPKIIIEHNFYETDEKKMSVDALANLIFERMDLSGKVIGEYSTAAFFTRQSKKEEKQHQLLVKCLLEEIINLFLKSVGSGYATSQTYFFQLQTPKQGI